MQMLSELSVRGVVRSKQETTRIATDYRLSQSCSGNCTVQTIPNDNFSTDDGESHSFTVHQVQYSRDRADHNIAIRAVGNVGSREGCKKVNIPPNACFNVELGQRLRGWQF
jgi:hypothetical protein